MPVPITTARLGLDPCWSEGRQVLLSDQGQRLVQDGV